MNSDSPSGDAESSATRAEASDDPHDLTARKAAARAVRVSERRLQQLADALPQIVWAARPDGTIDYYNDRWYTFSGFDPHHTGEESWTRITHPDDVDRCRERYLAAIGEGIPYESQFRFLDRSTGRHRWFLGRALPVHDESGAVVRWFGTFTDIDDFKRAQEAQRETEMNFGTIFEATGVGHVSSDPHTHRFLRVNRKYCEITGYTADELLAMTFDDITHPDDREARGDDFARFVRGEAPEYLVEKRYIRKDGTVVWVRVTSTLVRDPSGTPRATVAVVEDITGRKKAEEALRESEAMLEAAQRLAHVGTWELDLANLDDLASNRLRWTDETYRIFGYEPSGVDVTNDLFLGAVHPDDRAGVVASITEALTRRAPYEIEHRIVRPDGTERVVHECGSVVTDAHGALMRLVGSSQDVTERVCIEQALRASEERLRQAQKMEAVGRLAGGVAHDFNNLLTTILGYSAFLLTSEKLDAASREHVDEIRSAGERAAALTQQLLAFSRKQILKTEVLDLNEVVRSLGSLLGRLLGEDIDFETRLVGNGRGYVRADRTQLEQVIVNLALNARDAMPRGGKLTLETAVVELDEAYASVRPDVSAGQYVMLGVSDNGAGMDRETQQSIFEPFFTTKGPGKGTGLGLATVFGIVTQSGGHIWVYSELDQGTTFKIYLPAIAETTIAVVAGSPSAQAARAGETVLLVEDEEAVRRVTRSALQHYGYTVVEARDGEEALALCSPHEPRIDLLLTDVVMPRMGGRELAERLRERRPDLRVLYISGYTEDAILRHGVLSSDIAFLEKPFTPAQLARRVRQVIDTDLAARE